MTRRRAVELGAVAVHLALTLTLSYVVWGPYDGLEHDPEWASDHRLWPALVVLHIAAGAAIGRWWAIALPIAWALLSVPAGGYDTPVWIGIAFNLPFFWLPATVLGIALRKAVGHRTYPRAAGVLLLLAGLAAAVLVAVWLQVPGDPSDRPPARYKTIDEERGAYGGVRLGDGPERIFERFGPRGLVGEGDPAWPTALGIEDDVDAPTYVPSIWWYCYVDACFWIDSPHRNRKAAPSDTPPPDSQVHGVMLTSPGASTKRGIEVADPLGDAARAYPELDCRSVPYAEGLGSYGVCSGRIAGGPYVWFGGDPVNVVVVSADELD